MTNVPGWVIVISVALGGGPPRWEPVHVSLERFTDKETCEHRAVELRVPFIGFQIDCVAEHPTQGQVILQSGQITNGSVTTRIVSDWHLLTQSEGGVVSVTSGLSKETCEQMRQALDPSAQHCGSKTDGCFFTNSPSDIKMSQCFE